MLKASKVRKQLRILLALSHLRLIVKNNLHDSDAEFWITRPSIRPYDF